MTRTTSRDRVPLAVLAAVSLALLAACSGSGDSALADASASPSATAAPPSLDPSDPCPALVGDDGLVARALAAADGPAVDRGPLQDEMFRVVLSGPRHLKDPVGQIIDYLDDPAAYQPLDGGEDDVVTRAVRRVESACS